MLFETSIAKSVDISIEIMDISGRIIKRRSMTVNDRKRELFDIGHHTAGVYFVVVTDGQNQSTRRIIIR